MVDDADRLPDFERLLVALKCAGEPNFVPLAELIIAPEVIGAVLGRPPRSHADVVEFQVLCGYDYVNAWPHYDWNPAKLPPKDGHRCSAGRFSVYGDSDVTIEWMPEGIGPIAGKDDFAAYPFAPVDSIDFSDLAGYAACLPASMRLIVPHGDIFRRVTELMGFSHFCECIYEDPELVEMVFEKVGSIIYELFERALEYDRVGAIWYCDDIAYATGTLVSPEVLRRWAFPWYRRITQLAHDRGLPVIYHSDGALWEVLDDLLDGIGFDALHPVEPKAMDIVELKRVVAGRACLIGNIDVDLLARGTPEQVAELTARRVAEVAPGGGYVVGSSNTVPNYCAAANFRSMIETTRRLGRYPIAIDA